MAEVFDYGKLQRDPTVHEFLDTYRYVYENSVKNEGREHTDKAYQELFDVENRTDDLIEAQIIIEKEHLILNTVIADYKALAEEFMEAADPNYEIISAAVKATAGVYATAGSLEEITYMGEVAKATCDDIAVQSQLKMEMIQIFSALMFAWEHAKKKIRLGEDMEANAQAMVLTRRQTRKYYRFLTEDMGITFEDMEAAPFYRISLLNPQGLDGLWRIKKVTHPDNIKAIRYILFEEILSDKPMEEILLTPQPYPYYEMMDNAGYPEVADEFIRIAEELNKDIKYFQKNREDGGSSPDALIKKTGTITRGFAENAGKHSSTAGFGVSIGSSSAWGGTAQQAAAPKASFGSVFGKGMQNMAPEVKQEMGKSAAKGIAAEAAKEVGKGILRGLFRR